MPQVIIELAPSVKVSEQAMLTTVNQALGDSGVFRLSDIKSRLYRPEFCLVGDGAMPQGFVYVKVAIMAGRSDEIKAELAERVMTALKNLLSADNPDIQYGVEVVDLVGYLKG